MLQNVASAVTKWEVSESWITQFLHCHANKLTTKWTTGMDRERFLADSKRKYELYFNLLHSKMREHSVDERNTYNMDEKGFFVGINSHTKRIVSKAIWESKERTAALRDGNREWVTLLACPLDVVLFAPLSRHYTKKLTHYLQRTQGLTRITKPDFYSNFWPAWSATMTSELILKSFQATGVWPMDADAVLKRFNNHPPQQDEDAEIGEHGDGDSWPELRKIFDAAVADKARIEAKRLSRSLHSLQLNVIKKRPTQRTTLTTQDGDDWHGGAVFYSPRKLARDRARKAAELDEAAQLQLQKSRDRKAKVVATAHKKQQQEEAKFARQRAAEERREAKKAQAEVLAAERALKKQQNDAPIAQKSHNTLNKPASPPPKITARGRNSRLPAKYK
ncbi:uncharacterized protein M421DRAFT_10665 [Didymella exigua CBS 183.55]|uniref:HTH CENPB-type domain-containing protein n=1 Tax=Didymella exigua CBS 183.55 TaxID=1150837 RepID=A0A6A5R5N5_9PLEO|nr:uncharacterized protein M421DRAFT_10665 [Didymella exigua CBS 183.55]KAF1922314.1 hypothetical protein M421DRAFT_10665 [Didymella exigua CBS 183.55]